MLLTLKISYPTPKVALLLSVLLLAACTPATLERTAPPGQVTATETRAPAATATEAPATAATQTPATATVVPSPGPTGEATETAQPDEIGGALSARQLLAQQLGLEVAIVSAEPVEWPDACLGAPREGELCAQVITHGYRVTLQAGGGEYVFHTDQEGGVVRLTSAPEPETGDGLISWTQTTDGLCDAALISAVGVTFGSCGGPMIAGRLVLEERATQLAVLAATFAPFEAQTAAGRVVFKGSGDVAAEPVQQRMIAEWAQLVAREAAFGRSGASWGLALTWHREGGIAGFCDSVEVYIIGVAFATNCTGGQQINYGRTWLTASQLATLYDLIDTLAPFEFERTNPATADAMTIAIVFAGLGEQEASDEEVQAIQTIALETLASFDTTPE